MKEKGIKYLGPPGTRRAHTLAYDVCRLQGIVSGCLCIFSGGASRGSYASPWSEVSVVP